MTADKADCFAVISSGAEAGEGVGHPPCNHIIQGVALGNWGLLAVGGVEITHHIEAEAVEVDGIMRAFG